MITPLKEFLIDLEFESIPYIKLYLRELKMTLNKQRSYLYEKLYSVLLTSTLILGACSTQDDASKKDEDTKSGMKSNDPNKDKSKENKKITIKGNLRTSLKRR